MHRPKRDPNAPSRPRLPRAACWSVLLAGWWGAAAVGQPADTVPAGPAGGAAAAVADGGTGDGWPDLGLTDARLVELAAEGTVRLATIRMRSIAQARRRLTTNDYAVTALLLEAARGTLGDSESLLRRELEAWSLAGAGEEVERLTRLLLTLNPADEVAQLRLILNRIDRMQTVSERMGAYERLVMEGSGAFSPALRSRLALDWALLARETGDDRAFLSALTLATTLDVTNKAAASLYATYILPFARTDLERVEVLANVVLADPLDDGAIMSLARELLRVGAYRGGQRFLERALELKLRAGRPLSSEENVLTLITLWRAESPAAMLDRIAQEQAGFDAASDAEREQRIADGFIVDAYQEPTLESGIELLRLVALLSMGEEASGAAFTSQSSRDRLERSGGLPEFEPIESVRDAALAHPEEVVRSYWRTVRALGSDVSRQQEVRAWLETGANRPWFVDEQLGVRMLRERDRAISATYEQEGAARLKRVMVRLGVGFDLEGAREDLAALRGFTGSTALTDAALDRTEAWILAMSGEPAPAIERLTPLAEAGDPLAQLALASAYGVAGDSRGSALSYLRLAKAQPTTGLGIYAESRASALLSTEITPSAEALAIDDYALRTMPWIDTLVSDPHSALQLDVTPTSRLVESFELPKLRVVLRNSGQHPLGIGESAPINPRVLLTPSIVLGGLRYPTDLVPFVLAEVVSEARERNMPISNAQAEAVAARRLERLEAQMLEVLRFDARLSLGPGESLVAELDLAQVPLGVVAQRALGSRMRFRWRASQGFVASGGRAVGDSQGSSTFVAGPQSVSAETQIVVRVGLPLPEGLRASVDLLDGATGQRRVAVLSHVLSVMSTEPVLDASGQALIIEADEAVAAAVPELSRAAREFLFMRLCEIGSYGRMPKATHALAASLDEETTAAVLGTAVSGPSGFMQLVDRERLLGLAEASESAALRDIARIFRSTGTVRAVRDDDFEVLDDEGEDGR